MTRICSAGITLARKSVDEVAPESGAFCTLKCSLIHFPALPLESSNGEPWLQRSVKWHIEELEQVMLQLNEQLMQEDDIRLRNALEARARAVEHALEHVREALALESRSVTDESVPSGRPC